ncbi:MAG TPA: CoA ester lyase [Bacilli bacterium]|nr:CoA ester lyase [Bacilli bacterium]
MRRSLLFIPGNNPAMLQNADVFESDAVIIDLEDAVSISEKDSARNLVKNFLNSYRLPIEVIIRINGMDTDFYQADLEAIVSNNIDTILLPKANPRDLIKLDQILSKIEHKNGLTKKIGVIPIIELASSILDVREIATSPRVNGLLLGAEDLSSDLEVSRTLAGDEIFYARSMIAISCRAYNIDAIDTPFTDVRNEEGLLADSQKARGLGMNAKACIHPNQIDIVNKIFSPSKEQIEQALRMLKAFENAQKEGKGVFSLDGKMVDKPIIERAKKTIDKAKRFGLI